MEYIYPPIIIQIETSKRKKVVRLEEGNTLELYSGWLNRISTTLIYENGVLRLLSAKESRKLNKKK